MNLDSQKYQRIMEKQKVLNEKNFWVMLSDHPFKRKWDILMIFMLGYVATLVPYNICFKTNDI